jgi:hypothetical protein
MTNLLNLFLLEPCVTCSVRMAVPGLGVCIVCDAVTLAESVPDDISSLDTDRRE